MNKGVSLTPLVFAKAFLAHKRSLANTKVMPNKAYTFLNTKIMESPLLKELEKIIVIKAYIQTNAMSTN